MSPASSYASSRKSRCLTASQIAKDSGHFDQWSQFQNSLVGSYNDDLPAALKRGVEGVFDVSAQLPEAWVTSNKVMQTELFRYLDPDFVQFLKSAWGSSPSLFSNKVKAVTSGRLLCDLHNVYLAYDRLHKLRESGSWSEADWAAQVYDVLRISAGSLSDRRSHCSISLPQPLSEHKASKKAIPNLNARTLRPDGSLFIPQDLLAELTDAVESPFNFLARHRRANNSASHGGASSFKWQSTLCSKLPARPGFEIASCFWEDKKPEQQVLDVAYRQNRMATTAALRQLHALNIQAPIFGLVWSEGTVRAHVDWWEENEKFTIVSAPYPGHPKKSRRKNLFHDWDLSQPAGIIQVYLLLRNLDRWTVDGFRTRVVQGIISLVKQVSQNDRQVLQWRRRSSLGGKASRAEDAAEDHEPESISSPVKPRARTKVAPKAKRRATRRGA
ncbi:hypothetical protein GSI_06253 [Ganoderma sinense ZZ0214-1]|uniref:Uncharacterized protein n=1 Tax=Ganoderma sinense ZZ0214-1 TaxID=1077348 RepID=A0A2G8SCS6_9APHY|nr:hypothetical protein GSI_06253 [Ganoderma sinense ZZ0214-1]